MLEAEWTTAPHNAAGRIRYIEKSDDFIGNRTRDLPVCGKMPQQTTLLRAPIALSARNIFREGSPPGDKLSDFEYTRGSFMSPEVSTAMSVKFFLFWVVTPCTFECG
jgi:hypothetical protein